VSGTPVRRGVRTTAGRYPAAINGYLSFLLLGLGSGAVYAALSLGLVLVYRSSGVVSFAHGAIAMYVTYVYSEMREVGDVIFPVIGLPPRIHLTDHPTFLLALIVALVFAAGLGLLVYVVVFRVLRGAPPLAGVVASVGLLLALQATAALQFGSTTRTVLPVLPSTPVHLLGVTVPSDRLELAVVVLVLAAALALLSQRTRLGLASRAVAEDEEALSLLGWSPTKVAALSWTLSALLAGAVGILVAPITSLDPTTYSLLVVPALAAALVGGLSSYVVAALAALGIGALQAELLRTQQDLSWLRQPGLREAVPLLVVVAVAVIRGGLVPSRSTPAAARLPQATPPSRWLLLAVPIALVGLLALPSSDRLGLVVSIIGAIVCLSFVVLTGYAGQLSLAQMALAGVSGFLLARLTTAAHIPFPIAPVLAAVVAAGVGVLLGLAARRVRGVDLAVLTLAAGVAVQEAVFKSPVLTGGLGGAKVPPPKAGLDFGIGDGAGYPRLGFGLLVLAVLTGCAYGVARMRRGALGQRLLAVRANERAASAAGIDAPRVKLTAFAVAALLAGTAGALLGYSQGQLSFDSFGVLASLSFLAAAYVGGVGGIEGALVGGLLVPGGFVVELFGAGRYQLLLAGVALLLVALLRPEGLTGRRRGVAGGGRGGWARLTGQTGGAGGSGAASEVSSA